MSTKAPLLIRIVVYALALLSVAAGIPKVLQMPQELGFLSSLGLAGPAVSVLGIVQLAGGALLVLDRYRVMGAFLAGLVFLVSSVALMAGGNVPFGLFSLLPIVVLALVVFVRRGNESNGA